MSNGGAGTRGRGRKRGRKDAISGKWDAGTPNTVVSFQVKVSSFHKKVVLFHLIVNSLSGRDIGDVNKTY